MFRDERTGVLFDDLLHGVANDASGHHDDLGTRRYRLYFIEYFGSVIDLAERYREGPELTG